MSDPRIEAVCDLSPQQLGMLFETLSSSVAGLHIEQFVYTIDGNLNPSAFRQAWQAVVGRHAILRTAFVWKDRSQPLQVVLRRVELPVERQDWRALSQSDVQARLEEYLISDRLRGFTLTKAPLIRLALFQTSEDRHHLVMTEHHILLDGWCRPILRQEFLSLYQALVTGQEAQLEPSRSYREYIAWLKRQDLAAAETFWRRTLRGFRKPTVLGLADDFGMASDREHHYNRETSSLSVAETANLQSLARQHRVTLNALVQGAWALLLSRYSGESDVLFGTTVSGRPADLEGVETVIGLFFNTLPFRVKIAEKHTLWSFFQEIQAQHLELRRFEYCSTGQVHSWSDLPPSLPLFESILVFQNYPAASTRQAGGTIDLELVRAVTAQTRYPLTLMANGGSQLEVRLVSDGHRLRGSESARILDHFLALLKAIIADPQQDVQTLRGRIPANETPKIRPLPEFHSRDSIHACVDPRNATESMLTSVWAEVLGVKRVGIHDHFFELGGHSRLALHLFTRIKAITGKELPLATLFEAPTVAQLAAVLDRDGWSPSWSSLVAIQPGGSRPPFFFVHGHGGNVVRFRDLAHHLGPDQPFFGLQAVGLDGKQPGYTRIEEIAAHYLREIRAFQPAGPYYLGGFCFGGLVAFEMAQQLRTLGEQVALLVLLDIATPDYDRAAALQKPRRLHLHRERMKNLTAIGKLRYILERVRRKIGNKAVELHRRATQPVPQSLIEVARRHDEASRSYQLRVYPGRVILLRGSEKPWMYRDPLLGWERWVAGGLESHLVPGANDTILEEPNVRALAETLRGYLEKTQEEYGCRLQGAPDADTRTDSSGPIGSKPKIVSTRPRGWT